MLENLELMILFDFIRLLLDQVQGRDKLRGLTHQIEHKKVQQQFQKREGKELEVSLFIRQPIRMKTDRYRSTVFFFLKSVIVRNFNFEK